MARASTLLDRAEDLHDELCDEKTRFIDFFVQFREVDRVDDGPIEPTGRVSKIYGWRWDRDRIGPDGTVGGWYDGADEIEADVLVLDAAPRHFDVLCDDKHKHIVVYGSRSSGKSELGARWKIKRVAVSPKKALSLLVAKRKKARRFAEKKLLPLLPHGWLTTGSGNKGKKGYRKAADEIALHFRHGCMIDCLSAQVPDDARGDDQVGALIDESQLCPSEARENLILSGRDNTGIFIQTLETATLLAGEFEEYLDRAREDETYDVVELSVNDNIHLDVEYDPATGCYLPELAIWARKHMDPVRFRQEVGEWDDVAKRFRPQAAHVTGLVYHQFRRKAHIVEFPANVFDAKKHIQRIYSSIEDGVGDEITREVAARKFRKWLPYLVGMDFVPPMAAVICRVFKAPPGVPDLLWAVDEIGEENIDPTGLAKSLRTAGYHPAGVVPDAAGKRSEGKRSSVQRVREIGFDVRGPNRNPADRDRINSVNGKLCNAEGKITLLVDPRCKRLIAALQGQRLGDNKREKLMEHGEDNFARALGWLVDYHWPARLLRKAA